MLLHQSCWHCSDSGPKVSFWIPFYCSPRRIRFVNGHVWLVLNVLNRRNFRHGVSSPQRSYPRRRGLLRDRRWDDSLRLPPAPTSTSTFTKCARCRRSVDRRGGGQISLGERRIIQCQLLVNDVLVRLVWRRELLLFTHRVPARQARGFRYNIVDDYHFLWRVVAARLLVGEIDVTWALTPFAAACGLGRAQSRPTDDKLFADAGNIAVTARAGSSHKTPFASAHVAGSSITFVSPHNGEVVVYVSRAISTVCSGSWTLIDIPFSSFALILVVIIWRSSWRAVISVISVIFMTRASPPSGWSSSVVRFPTNVNFSFNWSRRRSGSRTRVISYDDDFSFRNSLTAGSFWVDSWPRHSPLALPSYVTAFRVQRWALLPSLLSSVSPSSAIGGLICALPCF